MDSPNIFKYSYYQVCNCNYIWGKEFKNEQSKIFGSKPLKNFTWSILEYVVPYLAFLIQDT